MTMSPTRPLRPTLILGLLAVISLSACSVTTRATEGGADQRGAGAAPDTGGGAVGDPGSGGGTGDTKPGDTDPGDTKPGDTKPGATGPDEPITGAPAPGHPPSGDGALHVEPVPGVVDSLPHAIDRVSVAADGRTATVYWWGGVDSCYGLDEVRVERDADGMPVITVLEGTLPGLGDVACIEIALSKATTITLDEPLYLDGSQG
jgi:hypothetical protein